MESVQKVTHVQHILIRPDSYVGSTEKSTGNYWLLDGEKFTQRSVSYSSALLKIFDEILVNAIDRNSLHPEEAKNISVLVDREAGLISVENSGPLGGISVEKHPTEGLWNPELTFGHLLTSTNYNDNEQRVTGGRNGYGAKLANVYSKLFIVTIKDGVNKVKYQQKWESNMSKCHPAKITKYSGKESSVNICFQPEWERFGMTQMDETIFKIIEKRVWDAMITTSPKCKVSFQGQSIKKLSFENYSKMYLDGDTKIATVTTDRWTVAVAPSDSGFQQVSFVNGICTTKGGTHVDHVASVLTAGIIEDLGKKIQLKPQYVKSTMFLFVKSTLVNPTFGSQVKSECTSKPQSFGSAFQVPSSFIKSVLKTGIQDEVTALSKFREMKELKKTDGSKKSKINGIPKLDDANWAGGTKSDQCTLIVTEGDSAKALAVAGLSVVGRDRYGVFPMRGKCKNVRDASVKQILGNQEFSDLKKILGLQQEKNYTSLKELRYGHLMIMTDADNDGSHIKGLILNNIHFFWPELLELGFVVSLVTPIIKATKGSQVLSFYTDTSYRHWYESDNRSSWKIKYYKGLGTSTSKEAQEYFKNLANLTVGFEADEDTEKSLVLAFDKKRADHRKTWLLESTAKPREELEVAYGKINNLKVTDFIHRDFVNFSLADLHRSIANMADGFKPSQRKVMFTCLRKKIKNELKVAQLAAMTAEFTSYHHGEVSLADTIVKLAQDYVGSNNMNLLEPCGQFGTRLQGGKDASQTRYIFTHLSQDAQKVFDPLDEPVLNYLDDDGRSIEPEYFVPVLPMVLINGTEGIGTGFSTYVPPYNPEDVKANIIRALEGKNLVPMTPWFNGFQGTITKDEDEGTWVAKGVYNVLAGGKYHVRELPPGRWTQDYKEHLDSLVDKGVISGYKNNSTTEMVDFVVDGYSGKDLHKDLKMTKAFHTTNMHLFHPKEGIKKYSSPEDILVDFVAIRLETYKKRKAHMIHAMTEECKLLSEKARFIQMVVDNELVVFRRKKQTIEADLKTKGFVEPFDHLMNIKTYQYTEEAIEKMLTEEKTLKAKLAELRKLTTVDMWKLDVIKC
jgi:DNA topoisomerase-2